MSPVKHEVFREGFGFAEGPRWRDGRLWVSDIAARCVVCLDERGDVLSTLDTPGRPSGLGWLPTGELLVVMMDERIVLRRDDGDWSVHSDLSHLASAPLNDMVVSHAGDAYVTGLGYDEMREERRATNILLVRPDGTAEKQDGEVWRPNGCVITSDGSRLLVAEARLHRLTEFRIASDGTLGYEGVWFELPSGSWADGICLDEEGAIWVADPKGKRCFRVSAHAQIVETIDTSPTPCIACTLGGGDGRTLFLLLSELGDFDDLRARKQARIETVRVSVPGGGSP